MSPMHVRICMRSCQQKQSCISALVVVNVQTLTNRLIQLHGCRIPRQIETGTLVEWITGKGITVPQILQLGPEEDNLESTPVVPGGTPFTWLFTTPGIYTYRSQVGAPLPFHFPCFFNIIRPKSTCDIALACRTTDLVHTDWTLLPQIFTFMVVDGTGN